MDHAIIRKAETIDSLTKVARAGRGGANRQPSSTATPAAGGARPVAESASAAGVAGGLEAWVSELPLAILRDPRATVSEWAWRREISGRALLNQQSAADAETTPVVGQRSPLQALWSTLAELSSTDIVQRWTTDIPLGQPALAPDTPLPLIPLSMVTALPMAWPAALKKLVLRDRLLAGVRDAGQSMLGEGLFLLNALSPDELSLGLVGNPFGSGSAHDRVRATRWRAERHSMPLADGRMVHRLRVDVQVDGQAVEITILSCHPALSIHVASDYVPVRVLCQQSDGIRWKSVV